MWVISKEGLILLGVVAALAVVGTVLLLLPDRAPVQPVVAQPVTVAPPVAPAPAAPLPVPVAPVPAAPTPSLAPSPVAAMPVTAIDGIVYGGEYAYQTEAAGFEIHWSNDAALLRVGLISPGIGYLAIGFDPVSRMQGANYILAAVVEGRAVVRDDFGTGPVAHGPDAANGGRDNILEYAGCEVEGRTYFEFVIPLDSGDPTDRRLVPGSTYRVLVAYHKTDDDFGAWHSRRGSGSMALQEAP